MWEFSSLLPISLLDSPAHKEACNAVQKECENCKKCFYDRKVAKLKQTNVRRWWKEIKGLTGLRCLESWVQQMLGDQLESTELLANSFNTFLASLTADFVLLPQIIPGSFFLVPEHLLLTHIPDTRPWEALNRTSQGGLILSRGKSGKSLLLNFNQSSLISIMPRWYKDTPLCFLSNPKLSLYQNVRHPK